MKRKKVIIISWIASVSVIATLLSWYLFSFWQESHFNIVSLKGVSLAMNYSHLLAPDSCIIESPSHGPVLLLWENDQFMVETATGQGFFTTYSRKDGKTLSFEDKDFLLHEAGKPVSINLDTGSQDKAWEWLRQAKDQEIRSLRFLTVDLEESHAMDSLDIPLLKKVAGLNPHIGLALNSSDLSRILPFFKPSVLYINGDSPFTEKEIELLSKQQGLQVLSVSNAEVLQARNLVFLSSLVHLRQLIITTSEVEQLPSLPHSLRALFFHSCTIKDVSLLASLKQIRALSLYNCTLKDIKPLSNLKNLIFINLGGTELSDISALNSLQQLKYIAAPKGISQEAFVSLLQAHPDLEMLQLGSPLIKNLDPLKQLRCLKALIITVGKEQDNSFFDVRTLYEMKNLRYLALTEELMASDDEALKLEKALPDCQVTFTKVICLGSGWILIFWPVVLVSIGVITYREKRRSARTVGKHG